ncbi:MAG: SDR family NAD(P)-dependent oxidoreductase [Alphaproteobacteria bacterium]|nr:SDR family NAD(P)-dependent oxidoreductase [Alphaproteobacteria bacterium]
MTSKVAIVVGVGAEAGLGATLSRRLAQTGQHVVLAGRTAARVEAAASGIRAGGGEATALAVDATSESEVSRLFDAAARAGTLDCVIYNAGNNVSKPIRDLEAKTFEDAWRVGCFGGFLVGREAARCMVPQGHGTILFTGASASLRGRASFAAFAAAKAGLRAVAQSMARELGPAGIHVAHIVIDGGIAGERLHKNRPERVQQAGEDGLLDLEAIADAFLAVLNQHRTAWTHELDLRPFKEPF